MNGGKKELWQVVHMAEEGKEKKNASRKSVLFQVTSLTVIAHERQASSGIVLPNTVILTC